MEDIITKKFRSWYQLDDPDCPQDLKPVIEQTYDDAYGAIFIVRIPRTNELQVARVFTIGTKAEISIDKTFKLA